MAPDQPWSGHDDGWTYIAQRFSGNGPGGAFLDTEVPLQGVTLTRSLSAPWEMQASVDEVYYTQAAADGYAILADWATVIWAVKDDQIRGGGLLVDSSRSGTSWNLDIVGFIDYPAGQPYTGTGWYGVKVDVLDVVRYVWGWLQEQPGGNLGLRLDQTKAGITVGVSKTQNQFDTVQSQQVFETDELKLAYHATPDLGDFLVKLFQLAAIDYEEQHAFSVDGESVEHDLKFYVPRKLKRRNELAFVVGENVELEPDFEHNSEEYASTVLCLGAGEGNTIRHGIIDVDRGPRVRRAQVVQDSTLRSDAACVEAARAEAAWRRVTSNDITQITVWDTDAVRTSEIDLGDEILLQGDIAGKDYQIWLRVKAATLSPDSSDSVVLDVVRADKVETNG